MDFNLYFYSLLILAFHVSHNVFSISDNYIYISTFYVHQALLGAFRQALLNKEDEYEPTFRKENNVHIDTGQSK